RGVYRSGDAADSAVSCARRRGRDVDHGGYQHNHSDRDRAVAATHCRPASVAGADRMKLGVVVQRFGADMTGGAEYHARRVAERLADEGHDVTVLTSTSR